MIPFGFDQFDNALRVEKLGIAKSLRRQQYRAARVAKKLATLLAGETVIRSARSVGVQIATEPGTRLAVDALEKLL